MTLALRCRCGTVQGRIERPADAGRARCYCRDCQAYARFLGAADAVLDPQGGTDIVATLPGHVRFTAGEERIACMSHSPKGLLRWYASCCRTPIGNTPRDPRVSYVGLVRPVLAVADDELERAVGPARIAVNVGSARGEVRASKAATVLGVLKIMRHVVGARLSGGWRRNPFFDAASGRPRVEPRVLTLAERRALEVA